MFMREIIFATGNKAKFAQLRFVAKYLNLPIGVVSGRELFGERANYDELGESVEEVALNGARIVAQRIGKPVMVEDTDFRVAALDGMPGIHAGEFLKEFGRLEILKRLEGARDRSATISSAVAYAEPNGTSQVFINRVRGTIAPQEKFGEYPDWISPTIENSFGGGYNAIFIPDGWDKTLAQISPEEAMSWSYREKNFEDLLRFLTAKE